MGAPGPRLPARPRARARLARLLERGWHGVMPPLCPVTGEEVGAHGSLSPRVWADLGLLLAGPRCAKCGREVPGAATAPALEPICDLCEAHPRPWDRGAAAMRYEGAGRSLALALKHRDRLDLAPLLAGWMARAGPALLAEADLVVPVPLHWRRRLSRRANQAAELSRALCRIAERPAAHAPLLLHRVRATPSQAGRDRAARAANVACAFALAPGARARVAGRAVLLVDDVLTTGATLGACAALLRTAGAVRVDVLAAALVAVEERPHMAVDAGLS